MAVQHPIADLLHGDGGQWSFRRWTPEHAIAAHGRDHGIPRPYRNREIERADDAHNPQRMPLFIHAMAGALAVHGKSIELTRETDGEIGDVDHFLHLAQTLRDDLAHFE